MREMEGQIEIMESSGALGPPEITTRPIIWSMTAKANPQKPPDFQSMLLAIAGHDLRQPLQVIHRWRKVQGTMTESRCADGEMVNPFGQRAEPLPTSTKPEF